MDWHFASPYIFFGFLLLPLLSYLLSKKRRQTGVLFPSTQIVKALPTRFLRRPGKFRFLALWLPVSGLLIALARPQKVISYSESTSTGIDIVIALDISPSMMALDLATQQNIVTRLDVAKQVTEEFIEKRPYDRIGLIAFGGNPYLVSPLTINHGWLLKNLERLHIGMAEQGTAIGSAIGMSVNRLKSLPSKSRIVILITDGESNVGKITPKKAAEVAATYRAKVYTIGIGREENARLPTFDKTGQIRKDRLGRIVWSRMAVGPVDEKTLQEIANLTDAQYFRATNAQQMGEIYDMIDQLETSEIKLKQYAEYQELYHWPLSISIFFILIFWRKL